MFSSYNKLKASLTRESIVKQSFFSLCCLQYLGQHHRRAWAREWAKTRSDNQNPQCSDVRLAREALNSAR
ncbi:unnamed protein product [Callosobruchus maculatus]|uniref:Uncharacterized protein n=1 Tax=Callosobruchus maculatus TaxID=64391 RepID=A0A653BU60_CALMS|nr:unnamed protein product [Callosobruchus maculatus]